MDRDRETRREMRMRYAAYRVAGYSQIRSAIEAGYSEKGASARAARLEARQDVQDRMMALREGYLSEELKKTDIGRKILAENEAREESESILKTMAREIIRDDLEILTFDPKCLFKSVDGRDHLRQLKQIKKKHRRVLSEINVESSEYEDNDGKLCRESKVKLKWKSSDAAKQRFLDYYGPSNKLEAAKILAELRSNPKRDEEQEQGGDRPQAIFNIPTNGRKYADEGKGEA